METAALLVVLAAIGGVVVVRTIFGTRRRAGARAASPAGRGSHGPPAAPVPAVPSNPSLGRPIGGGGRDGS